MHQTNEPFELKILSPRGPLQAKEALAPYEENALEFESCANPEAWLSRPFNYIEYGRDHTQETPAAAGEDKFEMSRWNSVFGMNLNASMTQKNPIRIETPPKHWSWCANPL